MAEAMAVFEALRQDPNVVLDVPAYNASVAALARGGEMAAAERLAEAAARLAKKQGGLGRRGRVALLCARRCHAPWGSPFGAEGPVQPSGQLGTCAHHCSPCSLPMQASLPLWRRTARWWRGTRGCARWGPACSSRAAPCRQA